MIKTISKILFLFLITHHQIAWSQEAILDSIRKNFEQYRDTAYQEKLFVHIDQNFYLTGETLWFRIFQVDGTLHKPTSVSKVAYIEVLDKNDHAVLQSKVQLTEVGGHGSLFIPATLGSGNYIVRVYTQWMRNYSPDFYFNKPVTIVNPFIRPEFEDKKDAPKPVVEFFPEGGNLIAGVRCKVGFKVTSPTSPDSLSIMVMEGNTDTVALLHPLKFGLGHFYINPRSGENYSCVIRTKGAVSNRLPLPRVYEAGYTLQLVDSTDNDISIRVLSKGQGDSPRPVYLLAHARMVTVHAEVKELSRESVEFRIAKSKLQPGINHITVFDSNRKPLCERLYFKSPDKNLTLQLNVDQSSFATRRKVSVDINASFHGTPIPSDVSMAVYKLDSLSTQEGGSILPYLYLTSDLTGNIESPDYYFSGDAQVKEAIDNLMLTHGWRRFKWDAVQHGTYSFNFIPEYRSHLVTGKVTKNDNSPASNILTYLSSPGKLVNLYTGRSNKNGEVYFEVHDFWGSRQLILQTNSSVDSTYNLSINNPYDEAPAGLKAVPFQINPAVEESLNWRSVSMQVQDIFYREEHDKILSVKNDSTAFYGQADETYNLDAYTRFPVMEEVMREYVPGVMVRMRRDGFHFIVLDRVNKGVLPDNPLVLLDGVPVFDIDKIMAFDPLRVKKLEVVTRNYYVGPATLPGIVSYSTYGGDLAGFEIDPRSVSVNYEGLQLQREFYSPQYEVQKARANRLPDQRHLIYWNPQIKIANEGKGVVEFFTSDVTGDYIVVVNGLAKDGIAGSTIHKFSVKRSDF